MSRRRRVAAGVIALAAAMLPLSGCTRVRTQPEAPFFERLYPLVTGRAWVFRVHRPGEPPVSSITRVERRIGDRVDVVSGATRYAYELRPDGLYRPSMGSYLLKAPVEADASWPGPAGGTVRVLESGLTVQVPAGTFEGCVRVEEALPAAAVRQVHTFCPDVGPVALEQYAEGVKLGHAELVNWAGGDGGA